MNSIARLFAKNQTVPARCSVLLLLPQQMDLDFYLEMRQVTAYEQLWDDIIKQFVSHSDIDTLERAMEAFQALRGTQALSATNTEKTAQLESGVVTPLRQLLESIDANNATPLQDETVQKLVTWLARLSLLLKNWDVTALLLAVPADNGLSILEAIAQVVDRGQMGFLEEEKVGSYYVSS
jgi:cohesin complex subunit SA-1/2